MRIAPGEALPCGQESQGVGPRGRTAEANRIVEARDSARAKIRGILVAERTSKIFGAHVDLQRREHVDDERLAHQIDGPAGIIARGRRAQTVIAAIDYWKDRKSTRLNSSHYCAPRMPSS